MGYRTLGACVADLAACGQLRAIEVEIDPFLEAAEIQRRVYQAQGPALLFRRVKGCRFPLLSNLFGTRARVHFLFRDTLARVRQLIELKADPSLALRRPWHYRGAPWTALSMAPRRVRSGPILRHEIRVSELPQVVAWPGDGGAFITLPQVYTEDPQRPSLWQSNLGMYRVQLSGGQYAPDREVGMHYQIHRGIGIHHAAAVARGEGLPVSVFVGGPPALSVAAVMPLPEGMSELTFAGALGGRRVPMIVRPGQPAIHAEADFCLVGSIDPQAQKPEGPFGDHLGYYSLAHDFPVLRVERVYHREGAIWPFTVVGRPPQEDTQFGALIHELTGPVIPTVVPGVREVHAVDAAGVHPLLLAVGSERYTPYAPRTRPQELLTQANALLGQGQMSLAKYLWLAAGEDDLSLRAHDVARFLTHVLARADWRRDLHFQTQGTIDTLDYSGTGLNEGSKLVIAAVGPVRRALIASVPSDLTLPAGFHSPRVALPGVLVLAGPSACDERGEQALERWVAQAPAEHPINAFALMVVVDDSEFTARNLDNFLWVTFTRSNPARDVTGFGAETTHKHWGCRGALVIDARIKPQHAPPLVPDDKVSRQVEALAAAGGPLAGLF